MTAQTSQIAEHRDIQTTVRYCLGVDTQTLKSVLKRCQIHGWRVANQAQPAPKMEPPGEILTASRESLPPGV